MVDSELARCRPSQWMGGAAQVVRRQPASAAAGAGGAAAAPAATGTGGRAWRGRTGGALPARAAAGAGGAAAACRGRADHGAALAGQHGAAAAAAAADHVARGRVRRRRGRGRVRQQLPPARGRRRARLHVPARPPAAAAVRVLGHGEGFMYQRVHLRPRGSGFWAVERVSCTNASTCGRAGRARAMERVRWRLPPALGRRRAAPVCRRAHQRPRRAGRRMSLPCQPLRRFRQASVLVALCQPACIALCTPAAAARSRPDAVAPAPPGCGGTGGSHALHGGHGFMLPRATPSSCSLSPGGRQLIRLL